MEINQSIRPIALHDKSKDTDRSMSSQSNVWILLRQSMPVSAIKPFVTQRVLLKASCNSKFFFLKIVFGTRCLLLESHLMWGNGVVLLPANQKSRCEGLGTVSAGCRRRRRCGPLPRLRRQGVWVSGVSGETGHGGPRSPHLRGR